MKKYFIVADVHSYFVPMQKALKEKGFDENNPDHIFVVCGDLFDRGPDTIILFNFASQMAKENRLVYIRGNHEDLLFEAIDEILENNKLNSVHYSNGTAETISCFTNENIYFLNPISAQKVVQDLRPLTNFIQEHSIDYFEIGDHILVHGWVPSGWNSEYYIAVKEDWKNGDWGEARWSNGIKAHHRGVVIEGKTIICGHYHTSWGHSRIDRKTKEFPRKDRPQELKEAFAPYEKKGIIAIDACVHYSGLCNCIVINEDGNRC